MKIVIVNTHMADHIGGSQVQCDVIADGLHKRGFDVIYLAIDKKSEYLAGYKITGVERGSSNISNKIISLDPDLVYWRFNKRYFYKCAKKISEKGIKIIFAVSNIKDLMPYSHSRPAKLTFPTIRSYVLRNLLSRYNHFGFKYVDGVTVNNEEQLFLSPIERSRYIPNAITDHCIDFNWNRPFVLWVANIKKRKRPEIFVKLANKFESENVDFLMIGNISDDVYQWIANKENTPSNFYFLGPKKLEEVNGALAASLFLVATSTPEGFSNNIIQAWLQNKPVVAYEFDPSGLIEKHQLGYVAHGNIDVMEDKTRLLIGNESLRRLTGDKAGKFANNYFSVKKTIDELEAFIKELQGNN